MENFSQLLQSGNAWIFVPSAILLGALHGLEPGHSKTMMAAFIVAVRGTVGQAVLLGLAATLSHTAVVWAVAMGGLYFGRNWSAEATEPYFQVASAALIILIALWMLWRTWREQRRERIESDHDHGHAHGHGEETHRIDTGHGIVDLEVFEDDVPPRFRVRFEGKSAVPQGQNVRIETVRPDGARQAFVLVSKGSYLESVDAIPEPHEFIARLSIGHGDHTHDFDVEFVEHDHGDAHDHGRLDVSDPGFQDAHERAHANDIKRRFATRNVTTGQIIGFGLTGGLIPCPAAITVLLLCLQLKRFTLGASLVLCFSIGLAVTMVMLDINVAKADLIEVQRQLSAATSAEAKAKSKLTVRFPTLKYEPKPLAEPTALDMSLPQWRDRISSESDPIKIAEGLLKKAELSAARAKADRIPDPTVGVYTASEAFRNERIIGLSVSIPLSGSYRSERMQQALQEAEAARAKVDRQKRDEEAEVVEAYADATGGLERWRLASQGLSTTRDSARLTQRAYSLGEADLQTLLLARRQALDATTATEQARVEALRWHYRLLVDAHLIWALEED